MPQIATAFPEDDDPEQPRRQLSTDAQIQANRAVTPQSALDKRAAPRVSIAELNAMDADQIRDRFEKIRRDDRSPAEQVMDLIDLPRNSIANIAVGKPTTGGVLGGAGLTALATGALGFALGGPPGAIAGAAAGASLFGAGAAGAGVVRAATSPEYRADVDKSTEGAMGAAGQPQISTSDALKAMGVKNRVVNGIVGFAGDVAFDPLTYVGAPGFGAALKSGGKTATITGSANRAINRAIAGAAAGTPVDSVWGRALATYGDLKPIAGETTAQTLERINRAVRGEVRGGMVNRGFRMMGAPVESSGGRLLDDLYAPIARDADHAAQIAAVREAFQTAQRGKVFPIGHAADDFGAEVLHVPFSGLVGEPIGVSVPAAKWANAAHARRVASLAAIHNLDPATAMHRSNLSAVPFVAATQIGDIEAQMAKVLDQHAETDNLFSATQKAADDGGISLPTAADEAAAETDATLTTLRSLKHQVQAKYEEAAKALAEPPPATKLRDAQDVLAQIEAVGIARVTARLAKARADNLEAMRQAFEMTRSVSPNAGVRLMAEQGERAIANGGANLSRIEAARDAASMQADILFKYAERLKIPLVEAAGGDEHMLRLWARHALHTDDDAVGMTAFGSVRDALSESGLESSSQMVKAAGWSDKWHRRIFGVRAGSQNRMLSDLAAMAAEGNTNGAIERQLFYKEIKKLANELGADTSPEALQDLAAYIRGKQYELREPGNATYYWTKFDPNVDPRLAPKRGADGKLVNPSAMREAVDRMGATIRNPTLRAKLDELAANLNAAYDEGAAQAMKAGLLKQPLTGYTGPHVMSERFADLVHAQSRAFDENPTLGPFSGRTSNQTRFWDEMYQKAHRFFEFDRKLLDDFPLSMKEADAEAAIRAKYNPAIADQVIEARQAVARFETLAKDNPDFRKQFPSRATDVFEMNELAAKGRFHTLTGGAVLPSEVQAFEIDPAVAMHQYVGSYQRLMANQLAAKQLADNSLQVDPAILKNVAGVPGAEVELKGGLKAFVDGKTKSRDGTETITVRIGDQRYRTLGASVRDRLSSQLMALEGRDIAGALVWEPLAEKYDDFARVLSAENSNQLLSGLDKLTSWWKASTLFHPSWVIFDLVGGTANALAGGARPEHLFDPKRYADAWRTVRALRDPAAGTKTLTIGGKTYTHGEYARILADRHVLANNVAAESMAQFIKANPTIAQQSNKLYRRLFGPMFRLNQQANDLTRTLAFNSFVEQGYSIDAAAHATIRAMFDFADYTSVEREYFRRIIPFYGWMRSNLGYQLHNMLQRPGYTNLAPKLANALEETIVGEAAVPEQLRPGWMRDNLAAQIAKNKDGTGGFSLMLGQGVLPQAEVVNAMLPVAGIDGAQKFLHYIVSGLNPVLSVPAQIGAGTEFFSGRTIKPAPLGDLSPTEFAANQIRPVAEVPKIAAAAGRSPAEAVGRSLVGGRLQAMDEARISSSRERQLREEETALRSAIRRADRAEDEDARVEAEIQLLHLYEQMRSIGFDIPRWAEKQLAALGEAP